MKARYLAVLVVALMSGAACAGDDVDVAAIAAQSGLTERQVRMVLGTHTSFSEYRTSFRQCERTLRRALGDEQLRELAARYKAEQGIASSG